MGKVPRNLDPENRGESVADAKIKLETCGPDAPGIIIRNLHGSGFRNSSAVYSASLLWTKIFWRGSTWRVSVTKTTKVRTWAGEGMRVSVNPKLRAEMKLCWVRQWGVYLQLVVRVGNLLGALFLYVTCSIAGCTGCVIGEVPRTSNTKWSV